MFIDGVFVSTDRLFYCAYNHPDYAEFHYIFGTGVEVVNVHCSRESYNTALESWRKHCEALRQAEINYAD